MSANVETMFFVRYAPWHGLGVRVESALSSEEALVRSGLDWEVFQRPIMTDDSKTIPGYKANIRSTDNSVLGVVTDRYLLEVFGSILSSFISHKCPGQLRTVPLILHDRYSMTFTHINLIFDYTEHKTS